MKIRIFIMAVLICLVTAQVTFGGVIFSKEDAQGDDKGGGSITYPLAKDFVKGAFDLRKFTLSEEKENYIFDIEIEADFKNNWRMAGGFDVQLFDVYLNLGKGKHIHTIMGRNAKISEGWDVALFISPSDNESSKKEIKDKNLKVWDDVSKPEDLTKDIYVPEKITVSKKKLTATISKKNFDLSKLKGIQVFVMSFEGFPTRDETYNRIVNKSAEEWRFGGGSDESEDSNVIDILGDNRELGKYTDTSYTTVKLIK